MGNQGKPVVGIPRWLTTANLLGIVLAFTLAIPFGARATHGQQPPTNLRDCGRVALTSFKLCWDDPGSATTTQYALQRSTNGDFTANVVDYPIARNTREFWDETFTPSGTFHYRVASVTGNGPADRSGYSNEDSISNGSGTLPSAAPAAPDQVATEPAGGGGVLLSWRDNSATETFFRVERGTGEQGANLTWEWRGNVGPKTGSGLRAEFRDADGVTGNYYRVTAFNGKACLGTNPFCSRSNAVGHTAVGVPGVDANAIVSMVNGIASGITNLVPSNIVGTVNAIVSPLASQATGLTTAIAPSGIVNSVNALVTPWTNLASGLASGLVSATTVASPYVSTVSSVIANPTGLVPNTNNYGLWIGAFNTSDTPPTQVVNYWILPVSCAGLSVLSTCPPPNPSSIGYSCLPEIPFFSARFCYYIDADPSS